MITSYNDVLKAKAHDPVSHPSHYAEQAVMLEPIFFCSKLPFAEGNALKYAFRAGFKSGESELKDLKKAQFYLNYVEDNHKDVLKLNDDQLLDADTVFYLLKFGKGIVQKCAMSECADGWSSAAWFFHELRYLIDERIGTLMQEAENGNA